MWTNGIEAERRRRDDATRNATTKRHESCEACCEQCRVEYCEECCRECCEACCVDFILSVSRISLFQSPGSRTGLSTARVAILCFRPTHSARNVARLSLCQSPGTHSFSLQDFRHGPENRKTCYIMLQAYTFCEECCEALTLSVSRISLFQSPGFQARTCEPEELLYHASGLYILRAILRGSYSFSLQALTL